MIRRRNNPFPHPFTFTYIFVMLLLLATPHFISAQGKKLNANEMIQAKIDSIFSDAQIRGLNTNARLRYDFSFADPDPKRIDLFAKRMQKDSFSIVTQKTISKMSYLRLSKNTVFDKKSMYAFEQKLKWIKYNFFIDTYAGFTISPADPDPVAVPESEFMSYLKSLSDEQLYWVGQKLFDVRSYDKALNALELGVARRYRQDTARYRYGLVLVATNEFNDAINQWKRAVEFNPNYLQAILDLGKIYFENGYFKEALDYYQKADAIKPNDPSILLHIAESLYPLERYNSSYDYAKRSFKMDRKNVFTKSLIKLLNTPKIKYLRKKLPEK